MEWPAVDKSAYDAQWRYPGVRSSCCGVGPLVSLRLAHKTSCIVSVRRSNCSFPECGDCGEGSWEQDL